MELCTVRTLSNLHHQTLFTANQTLRWKISLPAINKPSFSCFNTGFRYRTISSVKCAASDETSNGSSQFVEDKPSSVTTLEDVQPPVEEKEYGGDLKNESTNDSVVDGQSQISEFLDNLDIKFDSEDPYSLVLFGGIALFTVWLSSAVVGAIDAIPLFPKLMEVVGLAYTLWFSTRYLIFKKNRDELAAKVEEIKKQVLGSNGD